MLSSKLFDPFSRYSDLYKTRTTLIELLELQGYDCEVLKGFSIQDIEAKYENSQLDMLVYKQDETAKMCVKYYMNKSSTLKNNLEVIIDDLFIQGEFKLNAEKDTLLILMDEDANETTRDLIKYKFDKLGIFIIVMNINRLKYNILKHEKNPKQIIILTPEEKDEFMEHFNIQDEMQIPVIDRFDILAMSIFIRPHEVCKIVRRNPVSVNGLMYRVCV